MHTRLIVPNGFSRIGSGHGRPAQLYGAHCATFGEVGVKRVRHHDALFSKNQGHQSIARGHLSLGAEFHRNCS